MKRRRMKNDVRLTTDEVVRAVRIRRITKAGHLIARLKPLLKEISAKDMHGDEPEKIIVELAAVENAFAEFRAEYVELYEAFGNRLGENFPEK